MFRDFDEHNRRQHGRRPQTIDIPRRNSRTQQPRDWREAYLLQQETARQAQQEAAAWQQEATAWRQRAAELEQVSRKQAQATALRDKARESELENTVAQTEAKNAELTAALAAAQTINSDEREWEEKIRRMADDLENSKKRIERRYAAEAAQQQDRILRDMLPLADNLERALAHVAESDDKAGLDLTLKAFKTVLGQYGVTPLGSTGEIFDPQWHEAVGVVPNDGRPTGEIVSVTETGYAIEGKLLRPARVLVAGDSAQFGMRHR